MQQRTPGTENPAVSRSLSYIPELDGLRAVAVLAVILFHFSVPGFAGGFFGVDVFFVLSGFLITGILIKQRENGTFGYLSFYSNRFWRLYPALLVTIVLTFLVGAVVFSPYYFKPLAESSLAAGLSVSNFYFWSISGYFDQNAITKPLLHTWSLSVEEQFYFIWPLLIGFVVSLRSRAAGFLFVSITAVVSLIGAELLVRNNPSATFYLMPFRILEFSAGALVSLLQSRNLFKPTWLNDLLLLTALSMLLTTFLLFDEKTVSPGLKSLLPTVATVIVFLTAEFSRLGWLLSNRSFVHIGRISYSLYLVHWPVVVYFTYLFTDTLEPATLVSMALTTWLLAEAMHRYVETSFRRPQTQKGRNYLYRHRGTLSTCLVVLLAVPAVYTSLIGEIPGRYDAPLSTDEIDAGMSHRYADFRKHCRVDQIESKQCLAPGDTAILVIGNSHEPDALNAMDALIGDVPGYRLIYFGTTNRCNISLTPRGEAVTSITEHQCPERVSQLNNREFIKQLDHVIYSARYIFHPSKQLFVDLLTNFKKINPHLQFTIFGDYLYTNVDCAELTNRFGSTTSCRDPLYVANSKPLEDTGVLQNSFEHLDANFISKWDLLCSDEKLENCETETPDGIPMFYDQHHLSYEFARHLGRRMREAGLREFYVDSEI